MRLSNNFLLEEFVYSKSAIDNWIDNNPDQKAIENLELLCEKILQPLREKLGVAILISSGYRCRELNSLIGGAVNSQHMEGKAADIIIPAKNLFEVFLQINNEFDYDQVICEMDKWIHVSYNGSSNRNEALIAERVNGKVVYRRYQ